MYQLICLFTFKYFLKFDHGLRKCVKEATAIDMKFHNEPRAFPILFKLVKDCALWQEWNECSTNVFNKFMQGTKISFSRQCID